MEWTQFQYFQTVAQLQHFTNAAESLEISQPALSRSMARLEEELGAPLFERQGRSVVLNKYGKVFLNRVNRAIQEINLGQQEIKDLLDPSKGSISLGFIHSQGSNLIPDLLGSYRQSYPKSHFKLYQNMTKQLLDLLEAGQMDFCFCSEPLPRDNIRWVQLFKEEIILIVPKGHPLSQRTLIKVKELAEESFIMFKKELPMGERTRQIFREAGINPGIAFEGEEIGTVAGLVAARLGVALIPKLKIINIEGISRIRVTEPECQRVIGLAWVDGRYLSPAARQFKEFVLDHFTNQEELT